MSADASDFGVRRLRMVEEQLVRRGLRDEEVLAAMRSVPRHLFVPDEGAAEAYADSPLPIGLGQTISQPYMVALMTSLLEVDVRSKVLEIGAGSGYQTAVLAEVAGEVYAVERLAPLAERARADARPPRLRQRARRHRRRRQGLARAGAVPGHPGGGRRRRGAARAARAARRRRPARGPGGQEPRRPGADHRRARRRLLRGAARHALPVRAAGARREPGRAPQGRARRQWRGCGRGVAAGRRGRPR